MSDESTLPQRKKALQQALESGRYRSLTELIVDGTGHQLQRFTRSPSPPSTLYNVLFISLTTLLIGCLVSILLSETVTPEMLLIALWGVLVEGAVMVQARLANRQLRATLSENTIPALESEADFEVLETWLQRTFDTRKQLLFSLLMGISVGVSAPILWSVIRGGFTGFGPAVGVVLISFQAGTVWYFIVPMLSWFAQLSGYRLTLYPADPGNSEAIDRLSDLFNNWVFTGAMLGAIFTLGLIYFELITPATSIIFLILGTWGPLAVIFVSSQYALSQIIGRAKWQTLNDIQAQIERLRQQEEIPSPEALEHLDKLMDYHDRIRGTRNTALDLRAALNFLNSLLLPLLAFILANLDQVIAFFS